MKLHLGLTPSFSLELFSFRATLPVNGRGSVTACWSGSQGPEERRRERWVHPFDEARVRSIVRVRARSRLRPDEATSAFDALWRELYEPVQSCLIELGVPRELL